MKRSGYGPAGAGRGRPALPKPKAPLPFNLPSMKREAGIDGASGGIASAGAKWASPRPGASAPAEPAGQPSSNAAGSPAAAAPAQPAWGGAGVRAVQKKKTAEFPTLRSQPTPDPPQPSQPSQPPASQPPAPQPVRQAFVLEADNSDWAEDDDADMNFSAPLALPEVSIPPAPSPPPVQQSAPSQHFGHPQFGARDIQQLGPNRGRHQPPAAHWAAAIKGQQAELERQRQQQHDAFTVPHAIPMPDLKTVEEQKNLMKAKAESAQEARRRAEEERLREQRERSNQKLRELEMRMGLANKKDVKQETKASAAPPTSSVEPVSKATLSPKVLARPAQPVQSAWKSGPPVKLGTEGSRSESFDGGSASGDGASQIDSKPKVLLRRPTKGADGKNIDESDAGDILASLRGGNSEVVTDSREGSRSRRRNASKGEYGANDQPRRNNGHRDRDGGRQYDGPLDNETREQWLERRRRKTEARDAVRSVIDTCINRAVYGRRSSNRRGQGRRSERGGRGRRDRDGVQKSDSKTDSASTHGQDVQSQSADIPKSAESTQLDVGHGPPKLALPSPVQPVADASAFSAARPPPPRKPQQPSAWISRTPEQLPADLQQRPSRRPHSSRGQRQETAEMGTLSPSAQAARGARHSGSLSQAPRDRTVPPLNAGRPIAPQPARPAPWAPKLPKVALAPPMSSPGTATVASVVDAVVGETDTPPTAVPQAPAHLQNAGGGRGSASGEERDGSRPKKSTRKRGGHKERLKRERREQAAAERNVAKATAAVAQSTAAAAVSASAVEPKPQVKPYSTESLPPAGRGAGPAHISPDESSAAWSASSRAVPPTSFDEISRAFSNTPAGFPLVGAPFVPSVPLIPSTTAAMPSSRSTWSTPATWTDASSSASTWWGDRNAQSVPSSQNLPAARSNAGLSAGTVGSTAIAQQPQEQAGAPLVQSTAPAPRAQSEVVRNGDDSRSKRGRGRRGHSSSTRRRKQSENVQGGEIAEPGSRPKTEVKGPTSSLSLNASTPSDLVGNTAAASASPSTAAASVNITPVSQTTPGTGSATNAGQGTGTLGHRDRDAQRGRSGRGGGRGGRRGRHRPRDGTSEPGTAKPNGAPSSASGAPNGANGSSGMANNNSSSGTSTASASLPAAANDGQKAVSRSGGGGPRRGRGGRGRRGSRSGARQGNGRGDSAGAGNAQKQGGRDAAGSNSSTAPVPGSG